MKKLLTLLVTTLLSVSTFATDYFEYEDNVNAIIDMQSHCVLYYEYARSIMEVRQSGVSISRIKSGVSRSLRNEIGAEHPLFMTTLNELYLIIDDAYDINSGEHIDTIVEIFSNEVLSECLTTMEDLELEDELKDEEVTEDGLIFI